MQEAPRRKRTDIFEGLWLSRTVHSILSLWCRITARAVALPRSFYVWNAQQEAWPSHASPEFVMSSQTLLEVSAFYAEVLLQLQASHALHEWSQQTLLWQLFVSLYTDVGMPSTAMQCYLQFVVLEAEELSPSKCVMNAIHPVALLKAQALLHAPASASMKRPALVRADVASRENTVLSLGPRETRRHEATVTRGML